MAKRRRPNSHFSQVFLGSAAIVILILGWVLVASAGLTYMMHILPDDTLIVFLVGIMLVAISVLITYKSKKR